MSRPLQVADPEAKKDDLSWTWDCTAHHFSSSSGHSELQRLRRLAMKDSRLGATAQNAEPGTALELGISSRRLPFPSVAGMIFCAWPWPRVATARCRSKRGGTWRPSTEYPCGAHYYRDHCRGSRGQESYLYKYGACVPCEICRHYSDYVPNRSMPLFPCHTTQATVRKVPKQNKVLVRE